LTREKLTANVSFPLKGLKLSDYSSKEAVIDEDGVECVLPLPALCLKSFWLGLFQFRCMAAEVQLGR